MATKKVLLADVLWTAANQLLDPLFSSSASCCAAYAAEYEDVWSSRHGSWRAAAKKSQAVQFLKGLGCPVGGTRVFDTFESGSARQGVRYMWLLLAYHVALDEGLEIEVEA